MTTRQRGFSFIEVLIALSILLVGSVSILALFALGVNELIERKVVDRVARVSTEVQTIAQQHLDAQKPGEPPPRLKGEPLSDPEMTVDVLFIPAPFGGPRWWALATVLLREEPVRGLPPIPLSRSTMDPR